MSAEDKGEVSRRSTRAAAFKARDGLKAVNSNLSLIDSTLFSLPLWINGGRVLYLKLWTFYHYHELCLEAILYHYYIIIVVAVVAVYEVTFDRV